MLSVVACGVKSEEDSLIDTLDHVDEVNLVGFGFGDILRSCLSRDVNIGSPPIYVRPCR